MVLELNLKEIWITIIVETRFQNDFLFKTLVHKNLNICIVSKEDSSFLDMRVIKNYKIEIGIKLLQK